MIVMERFVKNLKSSEGATRLRRSSRDWEEHRQERGSRSVVRCGRPEPMEDRANTDPLAEHLEVLVRFELAQMDGSGCELGLGDREQASVDERPREEDGGRWRESDDPLYHLEWQREHFGLLRMRDERKERK